MDLQTLKNKLKDLEALQHHYKDFHTFAYDVIHDLLGFRYTRIQADIGDYLVRGPLYRMIQAQRGEAKTTLTAIYAVYRLIHNPSCRILIVSSGGKLSRQISNWVIQIIMHMPELACLRPDTQSGDRSSVEAFDINYMLKGPEKSPSIACLGVTSHMQGYRADVLIADDIESQKNSRAAGQRELLLERMNDFASICSTGDIIYLGTPQGVESVYNVLPSRGFDVRIWPGRYPTAEELPNYKGALAPTLLADIERDPSLQTGGGITGNRGKPTDPELLDEAALVKKELAQGRSHFQLQHMLDTRLMDSDRYPLKLSDLIVMDVPSVRGPIVINMIKSQENRVHLPTSFPLQDSMYRATSFGQEYGEYSGSVMYIDPSGGGKNGDELAWAGIKFLAGKLFVTCCSGTPGGFTEDRLSALESAIVKFKPQKLLIEKNFGNGAFTHIFQPRLHRLAKLVGHPIGIEEVWESGQKELRIIDVLEPIIQSGRLIIDRQLIEDDWQSVQKYPAEKRSCYSLFFQLARITRDKGSLIHDDRLDALAGAARYFSKRLVQDDEKIHEQIRADNYRKMIEDPLGNGRPLFGKQPEINAYSKFKRNF